MCASLLLRIRPALRTPKHSCPSLSWNWISTASTKCWTPASSSLHNNTKACFLFSRTSCKATQKLAGPLMLSRVWSGSTRCTRLPLVMERSVRSNSWDRQRLSKRKETSAVSDVFGPNVAPFTVRRISSLRVMNSRRIGRLTCGDGGGRPKQFSSPGEEKDQRHEEKGGADFPPAYWVNAGSSISL